jgi:hypothetical protein
LWAFVNFNAIIAANKEVSLLIAKNSKRGCYHMYTPKERADIGKYAHENGVKAKVQSTTENRD